MAMTGIGYPYDQNSWNGFGATKSPGPDGRTCNSDNPEDLCNFDCGTCADDCWWTTC